MLSSLQALDDWTFATLPSWVSTQYGRVSCALADDFFPWQHAPMDTSMSALPV